MISKYFIIVFILTIVLTRIALSIWPKHGPMLAGIQLHHYMYGIVLVIISLFVFKTTLLPIGLALFIDEVPLFFMFGGWDWPDNHWKEYFSLQCVLWIVIISVVGYFAINFISPYLNSIRFKS